MAEPHDRYSNVSLVLHWLIAALVIAQIVFVMIHDAAGEAENREMSRLYLDLHKSTGLSILLLTLVRLGWRVANPAIPLPDHMPRWQKITARANHVLFYVLLLAMPLVGWAASSAAGRAVESSPGL